MQPRAPEYYIHSWDFDGMLANKAFGDVMITFIREAVAANRCLDMDDYNKIADLAIKHHRNFFDALFLHTDIHAKHIVYVGSDRQGIDIDRINSFKLAPGHNAQFTLSCFPFFTALISRLKETYRLDIKLEKLLLSDAFENVQPGKKFDDVSRAFLMLTLEHYEKLVAAYPGDSTANRWKNIKDVEQYLSALCDQDPKYARNYVDHAKFLILFLQIQHALLMHTEGKEFLFRFCDDRPDILNAAFTSINEHRFLLPTNATVRIQQYDPDGNWDKFECEEVIKGESTKPITDLRLLFNAVRETHHTLNNIMREHTVPATLKKALSTERIKLSAEDNLHVLIALEQIIKSIFPGKAPKYVREILAVIAAAHENTNDISEGLKQIKKIAKAQIELATKKKGSRLATLASVLSKSTPPEADQLLRALLVLDIDRPDLSKLIGKTKPVRPSSGE